MTEVWKDIAEYEGLYQVSNQGRVKSLMLICRVVTKPRELILKQCADRGGYMKVGLVKNGKRTTKPVHRLVAEAFIPNPDNKPEINHIDGNKKNNSVDNLEFCTRLENIRHAWSTGLKSREQYQNSCGSKPVAQYDKNMNLVKIWPSASEAKRAGFSDSLICLCCKGKRKTHKGYIWKYA